MQADQYRMYPGAAREIDQVSATAGKVAIASEAQGPLRDL